MIEKRPFDVDYVLDQSGSEAVESVGELPILVGRAEKTGIRGLKIVSKLKTTQDDERKEQN